MFENANKLFFNSNRKISPQSETAKNLVLLEKEVEESITINMEFENLLVKCSSFLGKVVLGDELFDYKKFGFPNQKSLEESITSFCFGEKDLLGFRDNKDIWRNKDMKNEISVCMHGDLHVSQINVSGNEFLEKTLFGEHKVFDTYDDFSYKGYGLYAYQDWSEFLVSTLKYAEYLGKKKISEIVNWRDILEKEGGGRGTATAEAMFGTSFSEYDLKFLFERPVLSDKINKLEMFPLVICGMQGDNRKTPYLNEDKLSYLMEVSEGDINFDKFGKFYENKNFTKTVEYEEDDLIPVLIANYKYFARDRTKLYKIMDYFNAQK